MGDGSGSHKSVTWPSVELELAINSLQGGPKKTAHYTLVHIFAVHIFAKY